LNDTHNLTIPSLQITSFAAPSVVVRWQSKGFATWSAGAYWLDQETELAGLAGAPAALMSDLQGSLQELQWDLPLWSRNKALQELIILVGAAVENVSCQNPCCSWVPSAAHQFRQSSRSAIARRILLCSSQAVS
jgi:hypothetical protein